MAIGPDAAKHIRLHEATDRRGRIIPPGDHPSVYAYSDQPTDQTVLNSILSGTTLLIIYGHVEYTDILSEPRPGYVSEFCLGVTGMPDVAREADEDCKNHTSMK